MGNLYNYKSTFDEPIRIKQITDRIVLPHFVPVMNIVIYGIFAVILFLLRDFVSLSGKIMQGLPLAIHLGLPFLLSKYLTKLNPDGKKLYYYIYDFLLFFMGTYLLKSKYCHDKKMENIHKYTIVEKWR